LTLTGARNLGNIDAQPDRGSDERRPFRAFSESAGVRRMNGKAPFEYEGRAKPDSASREFGDEAASVFERSLVVEQRRRHIRDALADSDVFGALADDELDRLIRQGRTASFSEGAIVFRQGDPAEDLMIVLSGRIRLSSASRRGREVLFDFIGPGCCFGEVALIEGTTRKLDATAVKPSAIFTLRRRDVLACLEAHPEIAVRIIRVLCARLSRAMAMLEDRAQLGLSPRSARALLRLAREYGDGRRIDLKISQSEIAGLIGATRERVNRQLCAWCRCGILAVDEGRLTIVDQSALCAIAEED
jgi:CRP/FNR family cyclic AMP-dependent transcriptional regulator